MDLLKINEAAAKLGTSARTIRFYEEKGLLTPAKIPHNGYRLYSGHDLLRMQTILALREAGLALADIRTVLETYGMEESEEFLYLLEVQRSLLFAKRQDLDGQIRVNDRLIEAARTGCREPMGELIGYAALTRKERELRHSWKDLYPFDRQAESFDAMLQAKSQEYPGYGETLRLLVQLVDPKEDEWGVDLGTGTGNLTGFIAAKGVRMSAVDQSKEMLQICRRKFPLMETKLGNMLSVPYYEGTFDFAVSSYVLHRLGEEERLLALREMVRVLKPRGRIGLAAPLPEAEWTPLIRQLDRNGGGCRTRLLAAAEGVWMLLAELEPDRD